MFMLLSRLSLTLSEKHNQIKWEKIYIFFEIFSFYESKQKKKQKPRKWNWELSKSERRRRRKERRKRSRHLLFNIISILTEYLVIILPVLCSIVFYCSIQSTKFEFETKKKNKKLSQNVRLCVGHFMMLMRDQRPYIVRYVNKKKENHSDQKPFFHSFFFFLPRN